ncbi:DUF1043 family protein [uncultured Neptuniibacter sp.]|uniref:YhcB family protein n=1 Tax=uncultured Neptuniibacter sp. TaxID=502143 RepID=UPI00261BD39D|nr:DUF1043 family protein [uncultured Neptuniibacter sp.]
MENIWLLSIAALIIGAVIGFLMGRSGGNNNRQTELTQQLEDTRQELESYKSEVAEHFEKTASLVNDLTNSYKDVHQHLAEGAQELCQPGTIDMALEPAMTPKLESDETASDTSSPTPSVEEESVEPPRDYAPKTEEDEGTLSETFGLKEEKPESESEVNSQEPPLADAAIPTEEEKAKQA